MNKSDDGAVDVHRGHLLGIEVVIGFGLVLEFDILEPRVGFTMHFVYHFMIAAPDVRRRFLSVTD